MPYLHVPNEDLKVPRGTEEEQDEEDGSNGHVDADARSASELPCLRCVRWSLGVSGL